MAPAREISESLGNVLVVGACGFLGHHIVALVLDQAPKSKLFGIDLKTTVRRISGATYFDCDITDDALVQKIFSEVKPDVVIHTASALINLQKNKNLMWKVNVDGTNNLLKAAQENGTKAFVYTSSSSVTQGKENEYFNVDETWPVIIGDQQPEYYTNTKGVAEIAVLAQNRKPSNSFLTCAIRPAGIFGEGDVQTLPGLLQASSKGQSRFQIGDNNNLFDFTYVQNIAYAHILAATALLRTSKMSTQPLDHEKVDGEAFIITNESPVYFWDFARAVWQEAGDTVGTNPSKVWVISTGWALFIASIMEIILGIFGKEPSLNRVKVRFSAMTRYHNIAKAKQRLGYEPQVSLEEGIRRGVPEVMSRLGLDKKVAAEKKTQ